VATSAHSSPGLIPAVSDLNLKPLHFQGFEKGRNIPEPKPQATFIFPIFRVWHGTVPRLEHEATESTETSVCAATDLGSGSPRGGVDYGPATQSELLSLCDTCLASKQTKSHFFGAAWSSRRFAIIRSPAKAKKGISHLILLSRGADENIIVRISKPDRVRGSSHRAEEHACRPIGWGGFARPYDAACLLRAQPDALQSRLLNATRHTPRVTDPTSEPAYLR
jgi:hypothetical protein